MTDGELSKQIGENVRRERTAREMTQAALSELTGIAVPHISRLEKGGPPPNVATLRKVAEALGVPICTLIDPPPPKGKKEAVALTCSSSEWLVYGDQLHKAGIRSVTLTDCPAVLTSKAGERLHSRGPTVPAEAGRSVAGSAAALLAKEWPTVSFALPEGKSCPT